MKRIILGVVLLWASSFYFFSRVIPISPLLVLGGLALIVWGIVSLSLRSKKSAANNAVFAGAAYSFTDKDTGIGIYPDKRTVLLMQGKNRKEYGFADVRGWETNLQTGGNVVGQGVQVASHNLRTALENKKASGLFVKVRDIDHPEWRINMLKTEDQKRWMEIMRQLINENA